MRISPISLQRTFQSHLPEYKIQMDEEGYGKLSICREYTHVICINGIGMSITEPEYVCNLVDTDNVWGIRHIKQQRDMSALEKELDRRTSHKEKENKRASEEAGEEFTQEILDFFELNGWYEKKTL